MAIDINVELREYLRIMDDVVGTIESLEGTLAQAKATLERILTDDIPAVLHEHGFTKVTLNDSRTVSLETVYSVSQKNKDALASWLEQTNQGAIVKMEYDFPKGADLGEVDAYLKEIGVDYTKEVSIHPMSLKKAIREHLEGGGERPPVEAAEVNVFERAKVK